MPLPGAGATPTHDSGVPFHGRAADLAPGVFRSEGVYYGPAYMINGFEQTHITIDGEIESVL